jgi:hypothetical protein
MPFVATLFPNANKDDGTGGGNWGTQGSSIGGGAAWEQVKSVDGGYWARDDAGSESSFATATFYLDALPVFARRITGDPAAPPVKVRGWWLETSPATDVEATHGIGYSAATTIQTPFAVPGTPASEFSAFSVAENPDGPRPWVVEDFKGTSSDAYAIIEAERPASDYIGCDRVTVEVRFERDPQAGIYDLVGPYLPLPLAALLGGLAHARVDLRALAGAVYRLSGRRLWWDVAEDLELERELRSLRWPRVVDLGSRPRPRPLRA